MAQIETREALDQVDAICEAPGLDAIFIGPSDLSAALGVTGQMGDPILREAMDRIIGAAKRHGKLLALPGSPTEAGQWAAKGVDLLFLASDVACMRLGAQTLLKQARESLG
jgi:4-hydroxy-2-oxoheptanedioate aldolase